MAYSAPIKDIRFALEEIAAIDLLKAEGGFADLTDDLIVSVIEEAGKFSSDVLGPLNTVGDKNPARVSDGIVTPPPGFKDAFKQFAEGGWMGLAMDPAYGGAGLPHALSAAVYEMVTGANLAFSLAPLLSSGAMDAIHLHATEELRRLYLPRMVSGEWLATMNLTEPQAGSDLGALKTRAVPQPDGSYRLFGSKIFITWGEHDMTDNIVHLVLAKTPDAPEGSRGISLFLATKYLVNPDGSLGARNDLKCTGIEHKMGIHGSPTCSMTYGEKDGAVAYLVGAENKGLAAMFTMMNAARLMVGLQGVGVAEHAYQKALAFARERRQGRADGIDGAAAIIEHPDIRRTLWMMKSKIEAARAVCYMTALSSDEAAAADDEEDRAFAKRREEFLTPLAKSWSTDIGVEVASAGVQIHGGMGFVEETGAAQFYRDVRITPIYEGTNGIQALDLLTRKLTLAGGLAFKEFLDDVRQTVEDCETSSNEDVVEIGARLHTATNVLEEAGAWLTAALTNDRQSALSGATPFQTLAGEVCGGWCLAIGAVAAQRLLKEGDEDIEYLRGKIAGARFFAQTVLPLAAARLDDVKVGAERVFGAPDAALSSV
ncbi:MAG: acyl-CoA dehydrogenase [Caulobacterales bacterium]